MMEWEQIMVYLGYIAVVVAAIKGIQFLFSITPTGKLKEQVEKNTENLTRDYKRLEKIDSRINGIEQRIIDFEHLHETEIAEIKESLDVIGSSLTAMLTHMAEGNGVDKLKEQRDKLMDYYINGKR